MSIFIYSLAQFWCFEIFGLVRGGCQGDFFCRFHFTKYSTLSVLLDSFNSSLYFTKYSTLSVLLDSFNSSLFKVLVKSGHFIITHISLHSFRGSKFLKPFTLFWVLNLYFQQPSLLFDDLCKAPLASSKWTFHHLLILLFFIFSSCLIHSFTHVLTNIMNRMET